MSDSVSSYPNTNEKTKSHINPTVEEVDDLSSLEKQVPNQTVKGLSTRHITLLSLAAAIGTGLFIGSGGALSICGPFPLFFSYCLMSAFIWSIMTQIGIMTCLTPLAGETTLYALTRRYVSRSLAFTAGYNLYYAQAMIVPAEITACALIIKYWTDANPAIFISIFWVLTTVINIFPVKIFGEVEFWVATIKILCLTGLIIAGIVIFFGGLPDQHGVQGFRFWRDPGPFVEHLTTGATGRFLAVWTAIIKSGFSFILVPELLASSFGEIKNARKNIKFCCKQFVFRLMFFYIGGSFIIGVIISSNNPRLLNAIDSGASSAAASPFVLALISVPVLPHIINACILTSAASCGNGLFYSSTRVLYSMALRGEAPKIFAKVNRFGVPMYCVVASSLLSLLAFLNCSNSATTVFNWLTNIATISGFLSWIIVSITFIRFMKVINYHQYHDRLPYYVRGQVYCAWVCIGFFTILTLTNGYAVFFPKNWSVNDFFTAYVTVLIVIVLFVGSTIWRREWKLWYNPEDVNIEALIVAAEQEEASEIIVEKKKGWWRKIFFFVS